jgi:hypothetical protein
MREPIEQRGPIEQRECPAEVMRHVFVYVLVCLVLGAALITEWSAETTTVYIPFVILTKDVSTGATFEARLNIDGSWTIVHGSPLAAARVMPDLYSRCIAEALSDGTAVKLTPQSRKQRSGTLAEMEMVLEHDPVIRRCAPFRSLGAESDS